MEKEQKKVIVFSTLTCSWCTMVKNYLKDKKIDFENKDVSFDQKAADEMIKKSGQMGVPQLWINGDLVVGFDKEKINELLGL